MIQGQNMHIKLTTEDFNKIVRVALKKNKNLEIYIFFNIFNLSNLRLIEY